jgi:hypothetical protein
MIPPAARSHKLTIQQLGDETLVFDHENGKAHCLNPIAGRVWKACDGRTSLAKLARRLELPEAAVGLALEQLERRRLLDGSLRKLSAEKRRSRRDLLKKLAAAAMALPAIMTITAPGAHAATSAAPVAFCTGKPNGTVCGTNQICCSGACVSGQFICNGSCCQNGLRCSGAQCRTNNDCCSGLCIPFVGMCN